MTTGYPVGTVCVVCWVPSAVSFVRLGEFYAIASQAFVWRGGDIAPDGVLMNDGQVCEGMLVQELHHAPIFGNVSYPVAWLRPLSDPDAELETVEAVEETV